jgi:hypothetical protein
MLQSADFFAALIGEAYGTKSGIMQCVKRPPTLNLLWQFSPNKVAKEI